MSTAAAAPPESLPEPAPGPRPTVFGAVRRWWVGFGRPPRLMGLDVARALAVLGMVGAHIGHTADEVTLLDPATWSALVHGRSSILFAVLAGVSIALMTGRTRLPDAQRLTALRLGLVGRGAAIFVIGIVLELLGTPVAVILTFYGLLYVAAIPFLRWRPRRLLIAAAVLAVVGPVVLALLGIVAFGVNGAGVQLTLFGTYPITVWLAFVLAGMALGRMPLHTARTAAVMLLAGVLLAGAGYGLGAVGSAMSTASVEEGVVVEDGSLPSTAVGVPAEEVDLVGLVCDDWGDGDYYCYPAGAVESTDGGSDGGSVSESWSGAQEHPWAGVGASIADQAPGQAVLAAVVAVSPHSGGVAEVVGSGGFAIAVIGLCLLVSRPLRWVLLPLAALGSMPLTAYSAHLVAILAIAGPMSVPPGPLDWAWFALALVIGATVWAMLIGRGPLERLVGRAAQAMAGTPGPPVRTGPRVGG